MPEIVYEDNHLLIAVKPPNQLTQSDETGNLSLHEELKRYIAEKYQKPGAVYLGLVHRLDRPVGGLVAFARTSKAAARLSEQVRTHQMNREYLAVVENGALLLPEGDLEDTLVQEEESRMVRVVPKGTKGGQFARLHYRKITENVNDGTALASIRLETGRKHQIRVQLSHFGCPLLYDARYGHEVPGKNIALWGAILTVTHPTLKCGMKWVSKPQGSGFSGYERQIADYLKEFDRAEGEEL